VNDVKNREKTRILDFVCFHFLSHSSHGVALLFQVKLNTFYLLISTDNSQILGIHVQSVPEEEGPGIFETGRSKSVTELHTQ